MTARRKSFVALGIVMGLLFFAGSAFVSPTESMGKEMKSITGQIVGTQGFLTGYQCPVDQKAVMASVEADFLLATPDGKHYYMPNISTNLKVSYLLETVTVKGIVHDNSILVEELYYDGKKMWSREMQQQFLKEAYKHP